MEPEIRKPAKSEKTPRPKKQPPSTAEQLSGAMETFASPQRIKTEDLEVTGISRSGRVRKKSSKLMDFESPDDLADKHKRQRLQAQQLAERFGTPPPLTPSNSGHGPRKRKISGSQMVLQKIKMEPPVDISDNEAPFTESDSDDPVGMNEDETERFSTESASDDEVDPLMIDEKETGFRKLEPPEQGTPSQANSLYMLEKCKKKLIIKDGKIIGRMKAQRKDKGKTRFTAYMLWSKDVRQELIEQCPYMDFSAISKRLGELWATVPNLEKYNWRRRAKRMAAKPVPPPVVKSIDEPLWKTPVVASRKKFINKIEKKIVGNGKESKSPMKRTPLLNRIHLGAASITGRILDTSPSARGIGKDLANEPVIGTGIYKVVGTEPVDIAAHLKLLGESLTIIGERLKEHEGQIAVSGSVSVLLDSLLCALGPLVCLTQQVSESNGADPETLTQLLDNIAYIMPGL